MGDLAKLLEKLEKDGVPKDPRFNAADVAGWWQENFYITGESSRSLDAERVYFEGEPEMNIARNESTRIMHALLRDRFERRCLMAGLD